MLLFIVILNQNKFMPIVATGICDEKAMGTKDTVLQSGKNLAKAYLVTLNFTSVYSDFSFCDSKAII